MLKRVLSWLLVVAISLTLLPTAALAAPVENELVIEQGTFMQLCEGSVVQAAVYENSQAVESPAIEWSVSDENIIKLNASDRASAKNINFWALKTGQATITAKYGGFTDSITVTVSQAPQLSLRAVSLAALAHSLPSCFLRSFTKSALYPLPLGMGI